MVLQHIRRSTITEAELKSWLTYDKDSGIFHWRNREDQTPQWNGRFAGKIAGIVCKKGYRVINIQGGCLKPTD